MALISLFGLAATGITAYFELWRYRYLKRFSNKMLYLTLTFAVVTFGFMAETGHRGGQINHPEIRVDPLPVDANAFWSPHIENLINNVIWFVPWQTVHFFGYSIVFGTVLAVVLRIFGFWKSVPFSAGNFTPCMRRMRMSRGVSSGCPVIGSSVPGRISCTTRPVWSKILIDARECGSKMMSIFSGGFDRFQLGGLT